MDPYLLVTIGNQTLKTTIREGAGKLPVWPDTMIFNEKGAILKVVAMDDDVGADDNLGSGSFDISPCYSAPNVPGKFDIQLFSKGKLAGSVNVTLTFRL